MSENHERLSELYRRARCIFLDCDGIIFDSNSFKVEAMWAVLDEYPPEQREAMDRYWRKNGGVSRHVKFRHFFSEIARVSPVEPLVGDAVRRFSTWSLEGYRRTDPRPEALALARDAGSERTVVVSGALQSELTTVFREKGIDGAFAQVLGSPRSKLELVERVMTERGCTPERALLIGDGAGDFRVCRALDLHFAYLAEFSDWPHAEQELEGVPRVSIHERWVELLAAMKISYTQKP